MQDENAVYQKAWDESYKRRQNTLFYPCEDIVRFVNRYIRRRLGPSEYSQEFQTPPRCLDLGSGAGRHLKYLYENGFYPLGIELSPEASAQAAAWLRSEGIPDDGYEQHVGTSEALPFEKSSIDFAVSHGTLDSMPSASAEATMAELRRVLVPGALIYVDLIGRETARGGEATSDTDIRVTEEHEKGTIQSYFDRARIERLVCDFDVVEIWKVVHYDWDEKPTSSRWHLVLRNRVD